MFSLHLNIVLLFGHWCTTVLAGGWGLSALFFLGRASSFVLLSQSLLTFSDDVLAHLLRSESVQNSLYWKTFSSILCGYIPAFQPFPFEYGCPCSPFSNGFCEFHSLLTIFVSILMGIFTTTGDSCLSWITAVGLLMGMSTMRGVPNNGLGN